MSKWTSQYKIVELNKKRNLAIKQDREVEGEDASSINLFNNYSSLPKIITLSDSRVERYNQYDIMDQDLDLNSALDILAEEVCGNRGKNENLFNIKIHSNNENEINSSNIATLKSAIRYWEEIHNWKKELFPTVRNTLKYGDWIKHKNDKPTMPYKNVHPKTISMAIVDKNSDHMLSSYKIGNISLDTGPYVFAKHLKGTF